MRVSLAVTSYGHMCCGRDGTFSGKWNLPGNVCFVPLPLPGDIPG